MFVCVALFHRSCVYDTWSAKVAILLFQFLLVTMDGLSKRERGGYLLGKKVRWTYVQKDRGRHSSIPTLAAWIDKRS